MDFGESRCPSGQAIDFRVRKSMRLMEESLGADIELDAVARGAGLSRPHFYKLFRTQTGLTPNLYVNTLRMEHAIDRLVAARSPSPISATIWVFRRKAASRVSSPPMWAWRRRNTAGSPMSSSVPFLRLLRFRLAEAMSRVFRQKRLMAAGRLGSSRSPPAPRRARGHPGKNAGREDRRRARLWQRLQFFQPVRRLFLSRPPDRRRPVDSATGVYTLK